jgi:N-acetylglucosamine kinase-like BadF-type ATPase
MQNKERLVMGVDGGGSHTTACLATDLGEILKKSMIGASNYQSIVDAATKGVLVHAIQNAFTQAGRSISKIDTLCLGLAGVVFSSAAQRKLEAERILGNAASELAKTSLVVCSQLGWRGLVSCARGSGVFVHHPEIFQRMVGKINQSGVQLDPVQVAVKPVAGAVRLATTH